MNSDFGDPFVPPGTAVSASAFTPDPAGLEMLMVMGFTVGQATKALKETNNNIERAADWILSHQMEIDDCDDDIGAQASANVASSQQYRDGDSRKCHSSERLYSVFNQLI